VNARATTPQAADLRLSELDRLSAIDRQELVLELPLDAIEPDPNQPRRTFDETSLLELADSLRRLGQIHPVEVREFEGRYVLIDGERRWRAAKLAELSTLRALIRFAPDTPDEVRDRQFAANFHRDVMALIDQARYLQARIETLGNAAAVSRVIGLSVPRILNIVKTLKAQGAAARLRDSGVTRDADTIGAVVEVQKRDPAAAQALVEAARKSGKLTRRQAQDAARAVKGKSRVSAQSQVADGTPSGRRRTASVEPHLVVRLACEGTQDERAQWNKLSREHGRACLSLVATTARPGCVLVEFGAHSEPFRADGLRILDTVYEVAP
jgi:ParB family chromosome partitioning protein